MVESNELGEFTVGRWTVMPELDRLERAGHAVTIEPSTMAVLVYLTRHANNVVSTKILTKELWPGKVVGDDAIYQRIYRLRAVFEDDAHEAKYIETIPRKGYRLIAPVKFPDDSGTGSIMATGRPATVSALIIITLFLGGSFALWQQRPINTPPTAANQRIAYPRSIAVLPFVDMSAEQNQQYLGDGISEELIHALSNIPSLRVVARTSSFRFSGSDVDVVTIGEQLNVTRVLEGSVRKQGGRLRITAQLVNVADGYHIWSKTFDHDATNLTSFQTEIAAAVVKAFGAPGDVYTANDLRATSPNVDAFDHYLLGRQHMRSREIPALRRSITYFQQAIAMDPGYARAYAGLGMALVLESFYAGKPGREAMHKGLAAVEQALALNDEESEAYAALGLIKSGQHDLRGAEIAYRRAIELNPNYAMAYMWYGDVLNKTEREDEALRIINIAAELDPLSAHIRRNIGNYWMGRGQPELAQQYWREGIEVEPEYSGSYLELARNLIALGQLDNAIVLMNQYINQVGDNAYLTAPLVLIWCYRALNDLDTAEFWLDRLVATSAPASLVNHERALAFIARHDYERTSQLLHSWVSDALGDSRQLDHIAWYEMIIGHNTHAMRLYDRIEAMPDDPARPEGNLFNEDRIESGHLPAVNAAHLYLQTGKADRARELLERSRQFVTSWLHNHRFRSGALYTLASIDAIEGDQSQALTGLRQALEAGWTEQWLMLQDPNLVSLRDKPEFDRIISDLDLRLAVMRQRLPTAVNQTGLVSANR